ncbi:MAG: Flp family type IVb pilin [Henriciella sp.]|nr:Flp family type IVb pilin [Hyphomonadaceae bacterium]
MSGFRNAVSRFHRNESGATAVEYGLIMALMTIALISALAATGDSTSEKWKGVADDVGGAMNSAGS